LDKVKKQQYGLPLHISPIWHLHISDLYVKVSRAIGAQRSNNWGRLYVNSVEGQPGILLLLHAKQLNAKVKMQSQSQWNTPNSATRIDRLLSRTAYKVNPRAGPALHRLCHIIHPQFGHRQSLQQRKPDAAEGSISGAGARPLGQEEPWRPGCQSRHCLQVGGCTCGQGFFCCGNQSKAANPGKVATKLDLLNYCKTKNS